MILIVFVDESLTYDKDIVFDSDSHWKLIRGGMTSKDW